MRHEGRIWLDKISSYVFLFIGPAYGTSDQLWVNRVVIQNDQVQGVERKK